MAASIILAAFGIVFFAYGCLVLSLGSGTLFFAVWMVLAAIFLLAAWGAHAGWWERLPIIGRRTAQALAGIAVAWLVATQALVISGFNGTVEYTDDERGLDSIIVLGAQVRESGPSIVLANRLDAAVAYLDAHPSTRCIVSGGQGANEPEPEALAMARYLEQHGIDPTRITVEDRSANTQQNIANSLRLLDAQNDRVGIVTNNFHMFRALALARKQGLAHAFGIAAPSNPLFLPNNMLRESFGITKDFLVGNL